MEIRTEIIIHGTKEKIWNSLINFDDYKNWNPFITSIVGKAILGEKIKVQIKPPGSKGMTFNPIIKCIVSQKELSWLGHLFIPRLFDGYHKFELIDNNDESVTFKQSETFKGILVPLFKSQLKTNTKIGFIAMNEKLKKLIEQ